MTIAIVLVFVCFALIGAPLFAIFGAASMLLFNDPEAGTTITSVAVDVFSERFADSPTLVTLPLFTFAGYLMAEAGTPQRLVRVSRAFFGWMPGGLAIVCLVASAFFTTFTGGSGITIVAIGGLLFPALIAERYGEKFSLGLVTTGGSLGLLFPPSIPIVLYGVVAGILIDKLFLAGIIPGLVTMVTIMAYAYVIGGGKPRRLAMMLLAGAAVTAALSVQSTELTCDGDEPDSVCTVEHWSLFGTDSAEIPLREVEEASFTSLYTTHGRSFSFNAGENVDEAIVVTGPVADALFEWRHPETTIQVTEATGELRNAQVRTVLAEAGANLNRCLTAAGGGTARATWTVNIEGHPEDLHLAEGTGNPEADGCITQIIEASRFERANGPTDVEVSLAYVVPSATFTSSLTGFGGEGDMLWLLLILGVGGLGMMFMKPRALSTAPSRSTFDAKEAFSAFWDGKWEAILPFVLMIGLATGFLRIHEAAAFTALYVLIVEVFVYKDISLKKDLGRVIKESMTMLGAILAILSTALGFTGYLIQARVPDLMVEWMEEFISSPVMFLLVLNVFLLVVGMLMDIFSAIVVVVPLIVPIARAFNIDPYHLGIVFLLNLEIGYLTPPVGLNLFISSFRFNKPVALLYRAVLPFILLLIVSLIITAYVPSLSTLFTGLIDTQEMTSDSIEDEGGGGLDDLGGEGLDDLGGEGLDDLGGEGLDDLGGEGLEDLNDLGGEGLEDLDDLGGEGLEDLNDDLGGETLEDLNDDPGGETLDELE